MRNVLLLIIALLACPGVTAAEQGPIPKPKPRPCDCRPPRERLQDYTRQRDQLTQDNARLDARIAELDKQIAADRAEIQRLNADTSMPLYQRDEAVFEAEARMSRRRIDRESAREDKNFNNERLRPLETELIPEARNEVEQCTESCTLSGGDQPPPAGGDPPPPSGPSNESKCEACEPPAEELRRLEEERRQLVRGIEEIDERIRRLEAENRADQASIAELRALAGSDPTRQRIAAEMINRIEERIAQRTAAIEAARQTRAIAEDRIKEVDALLPPLRERVNTCNESCPVPTPVSDRRKWYFIGGGAAVAAALFTGGGDTPVSPPVVTNPNVTTIPVTTAPPVSSPAPTPTPAPTPVPAPPPRPTADGTYVCVQCGVVSDEGGHNQFVGLCPGLNGPVTVREGSITISHAAPFVPITGDFNTTTGAFTATGRGTVAGFPNVSVRAEGNANTSSGRITMTYTMGVNGELPGGRAITYSITLERR